MLHEMQWRAIAAIKLLFAVIHVDYFTIPFDDVIFPGHYFCPSTAIDRYTMVLIGRNGIDNRVNPNKTQSSIKRQSSFSFSHSSIFSKFTLFKTL